MVERIIAIDPGTTESGYVEWDGESLANFGKEANGKILIGLRRSFPLLTNSLVIEEINPYTMGMTIRDTILWSGRFQEAWERGGGTVYYIPRREVIKHLCGAGSGIGGPVVCAALRDRFAYNVRNYGKGTKKEPGFFYGFKSDVWQAFALAVTWWDKQ